MIRIKVKVKSRLFLAAMALLLAACGQRGPLYLPEPEQAPVEKTETKADETGEDREKSLRPVTE